VESALSVRKAPSVRCGSNLSVRHGCRKRTRPDESSPSGEQGKPSQHKQADADLAQQQYSGAKRGQATTQDEQTMYVDKVGEIQTNSVETFLDSHSKLLRYDTLTAEEIDRMQVNSTVLGASATQAEHLDPPQKYEKQHKLFRLAVDDLREAAGLAYTLAADPISATQADFDKYDRLVDEAASGLQQSNEILGKDYKTIDKGVQAVSTS
jgi:hypothetical protein